jgi:low temperature requirement protein LtrA
MTVMTHGNGHGNGHRLNAFRRDAERVTPLELFFDLVFVLAITQCTALMSHTPTWEGMGRGMVVLGLFWWTWIGYAWLTSVVDPEEGVVRIAMFAAMAAILVASLAIPHAFGDEALTLAISYGFVRAAHIALFAIASRDDPQLRRSVVGLGAGTALGVALVVIGTFLDPGPQLAVWTVALLLDVAEPLFFGADGWRLVPGHFAERHGLIIIVALGESIVALGVGADAGLSGGEIVAAVLGMALTVAMWWAYFDYVSITAVERLEAAEVGREQNAMARDGYSLLHFPLVAGIVLVAFGMHDTLAHRDEHLHTVPAFALTGGFGIYLLGHVAFRYRYFHTIKWVRLAAGLASFALWPLAREVDALVSLAAVTVLAIVFMGYESIRYAEARAEVRSAHSVHTEASL